MLQRNEKKREAVLHRMETRSERMKNETKDTAAKTTFFPNSADIIYPILSYVVWVRNAVTVDLESREREDRDRKIYD